MPKITLGITGLRETLGRDYGIEKLHWGVRSKQGPVYVGRLSRKRGTPSQRSQLFVSYVNGSPSFVRKCRKRWLDQGSSGERVILLPRGEVFYI